MASGIGLYGNIFLAHYLSDGRLDSSFGTNGGNIVDFGEYEYVNAMSIQADGKIVVTGGTIEDLENPLNCVLTARFMPDGSVDESFGNKGRSIYCDRDSYGKGIVIQRDGKIVVGGSNEISQHTFLLLRYKTNGVLDSSFGTDGAVKTNFNGGDEYINDLALQPDGKIIAAGVSNVSPFGINGQMTAVRYNTDGTLDEAFGSGGKATVKFEKYFGEARAVLMQAEGKIILGGRNYNDNLVNEYGNFGIARFTENGKVDSTFGINGIVATDFGDYDLCQDMVLQEDGKIIAVGQREGLVYAYALARYNGDVAENPLITQVKTWIRNNMLGWYTTNNSSVNYYSIQHSSNGSNFTEEKRVQAEIMPALIQIAQNHDKKIYSYALRNAASGYYRVAAVTKDGSTVYSDVIAYNSTIKQLNTSTVTIYPNPAKNMLHVSGLNVSANTTLTVVNAQGNILNQFH